MLQVCVGWEVSAHVHCCEQSTHWLETNGSITPCGTQKSNAGKAETGCCEGESRPSLASGALLAVPSVAWLVAVSPGLALPSRVYFLKEIPLLVDSIFENR